jgi:hypothetical protein
MGMGKYYGVYRELLPIKHSFQLLRTRESREWVGKFPLNTNCIFPFFPWLHPKQPFLYGP